MLSEDDTPRSAGEATADDYPRVRGLYIDLLKRALTHTLYWPPDLLPPSEYASKEWTDAVRDEMLRSRSIDPEAMRFEGRDWPKYAQTMVGLKRLDNVQRCVEQVLADDVPGDLIEAGVWRGGVAILMRGLLEAYGVTDRCVVAADSFEGLPPPNPDEYPQDGGDIHHTSDYLSVSRSRVERNFRMYGLLDDQVQFLEGWFRDTLPTVTDRRWAVVRVDGDLYESTMDTLMNLYPSLSVGGFLIIDDYSHEACRDAVAKYRSDHEIDDPIQEIDWTGVYWRKGS